jgi:hypothetical protein
MILEGPTPDTPVPAGSIIICGQLYCRAHIYITWREIKSGDIVSLRRFVALVRKDKLTRGILCPVCGQLFRAGARGRLCYISPPETLGERIHYFIAQGASP